MNSTPATKTLINLSESITDCHHSTPEFTNEGKMVVRSFNVKNGRLLRDKVSFTTDEDFRLRTSRATPQSGDLIITREAPMGEVCIVPDNLECCLGQRLVLIRPNAERVDSKYLLYMILSSFVQKQILSHDSSGSTVSNLRIPVLKELEIPYVELNVQQKIAAVLSALDDKLELNRRINTELEQMARTLYDYWFVQFDFPDATGKPYKSSDGQMVYNEQLKREIPKGWETLKLQDALEFEKGTEPGTDAYSEIQNNEYDLPFYRVGDIDGQTGTYIDSSKTKTKTVKPTDVIVTFDGSVGKMGLGLDGAISGGLRHIYDKAGKISDAGIYAIFSDEYITKTIERYATGSVILHASSSIPYLVIPYDEKVFAEFQKIIEPMFAKIIANRQQSQNLAHLRDWLLPMLMNGQVRVV